MKIMKNLLKEARDGALTTKRQAIARRDELLEMDRAYEADLRESEARVLAMEGLN